jgi:hypothetical protein
VATLSLGVLRWIDERTYLGDLMIKVTMDRDLPRGVGLVLDSAGNQIAFIPVPGGKRPEDADTLVLSIEDYAQYLRCL